MHIYTEYEDLSDSLKHAYTIQNEFVFKAHKHGRDFDRYT